MSDVITYQSLNSDACGQDWKKFIQLQVLEEGTQLLFQNVNEVKLGTLLSVIWRVLGTEDGEHGFYSGWAGDSSPCRRSSLGMEDDVCDEEDGCAD